jgi:hypothetical protein
MMDTKEMFKVQYQSGQGNIEVLSVLEKQGDSWILLKDSRLEDLIVAKFIKKDHFNINNKKVGYGQIVVTDKLTYITGYFEIPKEN